MTEKADTTRNYPIEYEMHLRFADGVVVHFTGESVSFEQIQKIPIRHRHLRTVVAVQQLMTEEMPKHKKD